MTVKEAINTRYSTRNYVPNAEISAEVKELILDAGYKAPNGLAIEPWKFLLVEGNMEDVTAACFGQKHVSDSSFMVAFLNYKHEYVKAHPEVFTAKLEKSGLREDQINMYLGMLESRGTQYYREQLMFAAAQMALQAVELEVGSVIVGGFDPVKMAEVLNIDTDKFEVGLMMSFGKNADTEMKNRIRRDREEVIGRVKL